MVLIGPSKQEFNETHTILQYYHVFA
jgi:hypothetical protein